MLPCTFKPPSGCFGKFPLEYFFVHIYSTFAYFRSHVRVLSSDHPKPAHSNTVMLLMLFLHILFLVGLFQHTKPASLLSHSSVLANALCEHLASCSPPLGSEKQPSLQSAAGCSSCGGASGMPQIQQDGTGFIVSEKILTSPRCIICLSLP